MTTESQRMNVRNVRGELVCPVCGLPGYSQVEPYDLIGPLAGTTICPNCLWEPGYDDSEFASPDAKPGLVDSALAYRAQWQNSGMPWRGHLNRKPEGWDAARQLEGLAKLASHLF